ncbi:putative WEB family protein At1g65010, chloroplastic isoform X2 [Phragmites australis]|uniref:putative WEB family protein At1g65010, chloroplastic isoform X2 n=1 Tax=Phragmites australis TaxID=29695 RepID=UPI002D77EC06|nr:putative WEB family protein At1g65010, chloroplastic isoform X2 [Phragmites australis]
MQSSRPRSGSFEAGLRATASSVTKEPKPSHRLQRSRSSAGGSSKASPSPERRRGVGGGGGAMQQRVAQLEEELRKEREEKARAVRELEELRRDGERCAKGGAEKVQLLEREVEKSKESERKMLESLIYQTKQLEQTKISLEEAKLEIATLQQANKGLEAAVAATRRGGMEQRSVKDLVFGGADEEIRVLRSELRTAMQGEERSRKALDDLSVALSDVTMEAKQVKIWLSEAQSELEAANAEAERLGVELTAAKARLRAVSDEHDRCRLEAEESAAAWGDKERVFLECVRASEEEVNRGRQENTKLVESQRVIRDENARLRDILKQAVAEANVVKESLELARGENARLNDVVAEKDSALQSLRQEYECIKVSEAAAQGSLKELNSLLAATTTACSTPTSTRTDPVPDHRFDQHLPNGVASSKNGTPEAASLRWMAEKPRIGSRRYSIGEPAKFKGGFSQSARMGNLNPKDRVFASLSNIADLKSAADAAVDDFDDEFDHIDESHYDDMKHKKKRPIFRKFGDLFRRKSLYKANLAPVHS